MPDSNEVEGCVIETTDYSFFDDGVLVAMTIGGDTGAYTEIVKRYGGIVFGTSMAIVGNYHTAEDIVQDTFLTGYLQLSQLREPDKVSAWLCTSARNKCYNYLSRSRVFQDIETLAMLPDMHDEMPDEVLLRSERRACVEAALAALSEKVRAVALMFYYEGHSLKRISEILNIPEGTVKRRLFDAREKLKREMRHMSDNRIPELMKDLVATIERKVKELKDYYSLHGGSYKGFNSIFDDTIKLIDNMPESKLKHHAYADAFSVASSVDRSLTGKAKEQAELGGNAGVICMMFINEIINGDDEKMIHRIDEEGIPKMEAMGAKNEKGELLFWKGAGLLKLDRLFAAKDVFTEALDYLRKDNIYYSNAVAALKAVALIEDIHSTLVSSTVNICGEGLHFDDGKITFVSQPGFSYRNDNYNLCRFSSLLYHASRCGGLLIDRTMAVGETITSPNERTKLTLNERDITLTVAAGTFINCVRLTLIDDCAAEIWYADGIGLVRMSIDFAGTQETYELCEYRINGGYGYMPLCEGNLWRYKKADLPGYYHQLFEREVVAFDGENANCSALDAVMMGKNCETDPDADSDLFINLASRHCDSWELDEAIRCLKLAAQKNSTAKASTMATAGLDYLKRCKEYVSKGYRFCPSSIAGSSIKKAGGKVTYLEAGDYSFGPYRWGTRHEENKIFGMKPFRFLDMLCGCLYDKRWAPGYTETYLYDGGPIVVNLVVDNGGTITVNAGTFDNCLKLTIEDEFKGADADYYFQGYSHVHCGKKVYWYAPNVGIVKFDCTWGSSLTSVCELSTYTSVSTDDEYMPVYLGCRWVYDEMTLEEGYRARRTYHIVSGLGDDHFMVEEQEFLYLGTEEEYEAMKKGC